MTTNKTILHTFANIKHSFRDVWLDIKWQTYRLKFYAVNSYRSTKNSIKTSWCSTKTNYREWQANSYNIRHNLVNGDPRFKIAKRSVPRLIALKVFKTYDTYISTKTTTRQNMLPIKNTIQLLKGALNKIIKLHQENTNQCTIHDISLWDSRYDDMILNGSRVLIENLNRDTIVALVNHMQEKINKPIPIFVTRGDEITEYHQRCLEVYSVVSILKRLIYELSGINKNAPDQYLNTIGVLGRNITNQIQELTKVSLQV